MPLTWDDPNSRHFEHGLDRGVLYLRDRDPIPWNGLKSLDEGGEGSTAMYYRDGIVYLADAEPGDFKAQLKTIMFPPEFGECLGYPEVTDGLFLDNQKPKRFDFCYRSLVGSGTEGDMFGYQIHLVYNVMASIGTRSRKTLGGDAEPVEFSFDLVCTPVKLAGYRPTAHFVIDTRDMSKSVIAEIEGILYGHDEDPIDDIIDDSFVEFIPGRMPTPAELFDIMNFGSAILFTVHPNGTYTVTAASSNLYSTGPHSFIVKNSSAVDNGDGTYHIATSGDTTVILE